MLARGLLGRLAAEVPKTKSSPHDLPQLACLLQRSILSRNGLAPPAVNALVRAYRTALVEYRRSYATTAAAPKKPASRKPAATKSTATAKKVVKKTGTAKTVGGRKKTVAAKRKSLAAKKKPAAKKRPVAKKKKKVVAKPKRAKKVLSPEQTEKLKIRALKKKALKEPQYNNIGAWQAFTSEALKLEGGGTQIEKLKACGAKFQALTPAEKEHYNHLANERNIIRKAEYKAWIESHTPEEIRIANRARSVLRQKLAAGEKKSAKYTQKLHDERHVKPPNSPYLRFSMDRRVSGDFKNISLGDSSKLIGNEWNALSASEKQPYINAYEAEKQALAGSA